MTGRRGSFGLQWRAGKPPLVMGILNVTPDSFSDGGRFHTLDAAVARGVDLVSQGADMLDIGGESTRPGSQPVLLEEELRRTIPVIEGLSRRVSVPLSIDTAKSEVARRALAAGASLINDVTALRGDPAMASVAAQSRCGVILMHMRGEPRTMQQRPRYADVAADVAAFLKSAAARAQRAGIHASRILIDPGIGFGKTLAHNLRILSRLDDLVKLGYPVVLGASRKSFIGKLTGAAVDQRLPGSLACLAVAREAGAAVVRVHDVAEAKQFLEVTEAIGAAA